MAIFLHRSLFCLLFLLAFHGGPRLSPLAKPLPHPPDDPDVCWCLKEPQPRRVENAARFREKFGSIAWHFSAWVRSDHNDPRNAPATDPETPEYFRQVDTFSRLLESMRQMIDKEYDLTLDVVGVRDGWVIFTPLASELIVDRLACFELAQGGNQEMKQRLSSTPAVTLVFDFSGKKYRHKRDVQEDLLQDLPEHLRHGDLPFSRLPTRVFTPELLRALKGDKLNFRVQLRIVDVHYVAQRQHGDFSTILFSVKLRSIRE
jgi:hypothetical protein